MNIADFLVILFVLLWGGLGIRYFFQRQQGFSDREIRFLQGLYVFHIVVSLFFSYYILLNGGDATAYWFMRRFSLEQDWGFYLRTGTSFVLFLTYPLVKYLQLNFYSGGLLFAVLGFQGFLYLHCIIRRFIKKPVRLYGIRVFPFILYLPNLHFWSSGIGKDALVLFAIMLFFYSLFQLRRKWFWCFFALFLAYHIRPHIALFLIVAAFLGILIDRKMRLSIKLSLALLMLLGGILMFNSVLAFMKMDEVSTESISQFSSTKASDLRKGSSSAVAIGNYPFPLKVFTFLYLPLFFDVNNALAVISSFENLVLLFLSGYLFRLKPIAAFKAAPLPVKSSLIFAVICSCAFAVTLSNMGIMLRQKNPVVFCLLVCIFWCFAYQKNLTKR